VNDGGQIGRRLEEVMSKKTNQAAQAAAKAEAEVAPVGQPADVVESDSTPPEASGAESAEAVAQADEVEADADAGEDDQAHVEPAEPAETVKALVLSNNHLGNVGDVIAVPAAHAEALRLGGLIDTHPNAFPKEG